MTSKSIEKLRDPKWYLEHFTKIKGKTPGLIPFILTEAQKDLFNTINYNTRVIAIKARQIGFSTAISGYMYHKTITTPGTTTALVAHKADVATEFLDKIKTFWRSTPEALRPTIHFNSKYEMSFPGLDSKIVVMSGENVGRGFTIHNALCVAGDTEVYAKDGESFKVEDLEEGTQILNGSGGFSSVKKVIKKKNNEKLLEIDVIGAIKKLRVTPDHELFIRTQGASDRRNGKWVQAKDLTTEDRVGFPRTPYRSFVKQINMDEFLTKGYESRTKKLGNIDADYGLGELCGWYLSEGTILFSKTKKVNAVCFSIHEKEETEFVNVLKAVLGENVEYRIDRNEGKGITVVLYAAPLAKWLYKMFYHLHDKKSIPEYAWRFGSKFLKGLVHGCIRGDGSDVNIDKLILVTTSKKMALQFKRLIISLRYGVPSIKEYERDRYGVKSKNVFIISMAGPCNYKIRRDMGLPLKEYKDGRNRYRLNRSSKINLGARSWRRGTYHYWAKVRSIKESEADEFVYDIVLDKEPHSFVTQGGVVHNCSELAMWEKPDEMMLALENAVPANGKIVIESTPSGIGGLFHRMWSAKNNGYVKVEYGWWWHYTQEEIDEIRGRINDPLKFAQEYELEFLASGRQVFNPEIMRKVRKTVWDVGTKVPIDNNTEFTVMEREDGLRIYKPVDEKAMYVVGADVAEGVVGGDYSTATIFNRTSGEEVAFYRGHIPADKFGVKLAEWGLIYNKALMVIEINNHGLTTVTAVKNTMYPHLYFRPSKFDSLGTSWSDRLGWKTTRVTRPLMIDDLNEALREDSITLHSRETSDEMVTFIYDQGNNMVTMSGFHDDGIFSSAIGFQGFKVLYDKPLDQINYENILPSSTSY